MGRENTDIMHIFAQNILLYKKFPRNGFWWILDMLFYTEKVLLLIDITTIYSGDSVTHTNNA